MGDDEEALLGLWREKRGEVEPEDLSGKFVVQLGVVTEELNRRWYEANTGHVITDVQRQVRHPRSAGWEPPSTGGWRAARPSSSPSSCCHGSFPRKPPREKYMPQLQHNMWVVAARTAVLSVITGGR